jgi:cation diffusion facilitator CzcD-associated flavoprotein CzcO
MSSASDRYCIIGAGAAGLAVARRLSERGIAFDILEAHSDVGGIWDMTNPGSPMYESAHFISSKSVSGYTDMQFPASTPEYPSHRDVLALIRAYAARHQLQRHVEFNQTVTRVEPHGDRWLVETNTRRLYRGVILASGFQRTPNMPNYPGMDAFQGESFHSVRYRSSRVFDGKRALVVGCGASGVDIANDAATRASRTLLSMRRGHYFVPKHILGQPTDVWARPGGGVPLPFRARQFLLERLLHRLHGDLTRYGLPKPDHRILERPPVISSHIVDHLSHGRILPKPDIERITAHGVVFTDGTEEPVDVIVYATGYLECWPYLDTSTVRPTGEGDLVLHLFHKRHDNLFVAGLLRTNAGGYAIFEDQGDVIADAILCNEAQRARLRRLKTTTRERRRYQKNDYQSSYLDAEAYRHRLRALRRAIGGGPS